MGIHHSGSLSKLPRSTSSVGYIGPFLSVPLGKQRAVRQDAQDALYSSRRSGIRKRENFGVIFDSRIVDHRESISQGGRRTHFAHSTAPHNRAGVCVPR